MHIKTFCVTWINRIRLKNISMLIKEFHLKGLKGGLMSTVDSENLLCHSPNHLTSNIHYLNMMWLLQFLITHWCYHTRSCTTDVLWQNGSCKRMGGWSWYHCTITTLGHCTVKCTLCSMLTQIHLRIGTDGHKHRSKGIHNSIQQITLRQ